VQRTGTFAIKELTFPWFGPSKCILVQLKVRFRPISIFSTHQTIRRPEEKDLANHGRET
jgi:hypothetical protein